VTNNYSVQERQSGPTSFVFRVTEDQLSSNRIIGQLAYTIVYLALINYSRFVEDVFNEFRSHPSDLVRVACAKGAHIVERQDLVQELIEKEPDGRPKTLLLNTMSTGAFNTLSK